MLRRYIVEALSASCKKRITLIYYVVAEGKPRREFSLNVVNSVSV